ncbi:MAG TPA: HEAT repeat domain-containing protein [Bryobacteraceae bacterium]|nr:HEAT repeat domain-containing protein [Bryobacteraceae bacterium]
MSGKFTMMRTVLILSILGAAPSSGSQTPAERAWSILQEGLANKRAEKRTNAVHALRLLPNNPRAQQMAESALGDQSPKVRAAAARALGRMGAVSSVAKLKAVLNDKEPAVVLAAARSLFLLGDREEAYEIDYEVLIGERKGADGFVESQLNELKNPKVVAMMGFETGLGFVPFAGTGYEVFKRINKADGSPIRATAARELATDRDPKITAALARACSDKKWSVRAAAVDAIANREDPALLNVITPVLDDKSDIVRYDASAAVLRLSGGKTGE